MAQATQTHHIECQQFPSLEEAGDAVRRAVEACCAAEAFRVSAEQMRSATEMQADLAITLLPHLSHLSAWAGGEVLSTILERFFQDADRSRFALINAVTSVARDTTDPEVRWRLEELGGGITANRPPVPQPDDEAAMALVG
jgi:hypothetical protein